MGTAAGAGGVGRTDGPGVPDGASDRGAQPERTRLAWRRTTLAFTLVVVLAGRKVVVADGGHAGMAGVVVALEALLWVGFLVLAHRRIRDLAGERGLPPVAEATMLGAAGVVLLAAVLGGLLLAAGA